MSPGGNQRHLAPEVLSRFHSLAAQASAGETEPGYISYKGQTVRNVTEHPSLLWLPLTTTTNAVVLLGRQVWAAGVVLYEILLNKAPWPSYPHECMKPGTKIVTYNVDKLDVHAPADYPACTASPHATLLPPPSSLSPHATFCLALVQGFLRCFDPCCH